MEKYYILSLNNNVYSEVENGKRINSSFDIFTKEDENSSIKMPGMGQGIILGEERDGVMYSLMPDDGIVINYVPRNEEMVDENNYQEVENIIKEYKEKGKSSLEEYKKLVEEEEIMKNINEKTFSFRKNYFINLYKTVMLSDVMKSKYENLQNKIEKIKDDMYDKADKLSKIEKYLKENEKYWEIKDDKIEFKNISVMTQYYSLLNQLID